MMRLRFLLVALAVFLPRTVAAQPNDEVRYYHLDAIGSVRIVTDANGQVFSRHDYQPFGQEYPTAAGSNTRRFAGKEFDAETQYDYFGGRFYRSGSARFTTADPVLDLEPALVDPQRWNRYTYVRNTPFRHVDPDGRAIETLWDVFNLGTGLVSLGANIAAGNIGGAALDVAGLLVDAGATLVPGVPGGAGSAIKAARLAENARAGRLFERAVLDALGAAKNTGGVSEVASRVTTIPDLPIGKLFGVTDIKNVKALTLDRQLRAQIAAAETAGLPFNLIISTGTRSISGPLKRAIEQTGGRVFIFDERTRRFAEAAFDISGRLVP